MSVNVNLCIFCMCSVAAIKCCFVLHFIYILHKFLRDWSVKLLLFEKEKLAAENISKI